MLEVGPLLISEFMASNNNTLDDGDGNSPDWIEIYNSSNAPLSLKDYYLTDNPDDLTQWQFPAVTVGANDYLVVFASNGREDVDDPAKNPFLDPAGNLHTNFALRADGDSVLLVEPDGETVAHAYREYPEQLQDYSYGLPDSTTLWDMLVSSGSPVSYHVPIPAEDELDWTTTDFDDSGWVDSVELETAGLVITEAKAGSPDWLEIQNVSDQPIVTTDWFVAINDTSAGDISDVHDVIWDLSAAGPIAAGDVLYRTDDLLDNYWGSDISWETGSGWAMIVDGGGQTAKVVDFVVWGYDEAEIAYMKFDAGGFTNLTADNQWHGAGVPGGAGEVELINIEHNWSYEQTNTDLGTEWRELGYDDSLWPKGDALLYVENSGLPAAKNTALDIGGNPRTSTYYFRSHFTLDAHPDSVTQLDLRTVIDDGAIIYINGQEVYRLRIGDNEVVDHFFYVGPTVGNASYEGPFSISTDALVAGDNLIAVEVHQTSSGSSDIVLGLELQATVLEPVLERVGNSDVNVSSDFDLPADPTMGVQNSTLTLPFVPGTIPALTGLGFSDDADFDHLIKTDVGPVMRDVNASLWSRIEFPVGDVSQFDVLTLKMQYDDGFVAFLNGVEVARRNAPDPLQYNSSATETRDDNQAIVFEEIDISGSLANLVQLETNVLAIQGLNFGAGDADFLILPELIATSNLDGPQYMTTPTPGQDNLAGTLGTVADTKFSVDRGFYDQPFEVEITSGTLAAEIRYTLDGIEPTMNYGTVYTDPIAVTTTTTLRAAAFKPGYIPTDVDTQTYIFLDDVIRQDGAGLPAEWQAGISANYEMDPDVVGQDGQDMFNGLYAATIKDDLRAVPTMSLVLDPASMWDQAIGIYSNTGSRGFDWERAVSVELIDGDLAYENGNTLFHINAGVRLQGGASRNAGNLKHSLRLVFKGMYGAAKLKYPLFGDEANDEFDTITLRAGFNDNIVRGNFTFLQDRWVAQTQADLGGLSPHGTWVHLYINGTYWGLYNPVERPAAPFAAAYLGGDKEDYDAIVTNSFTDGNNASWNQLKSLVAQDPMDYAAVQDMLDIPAFIDYMMINQYGGNGDWPHNNWYATSSRQPGGKWRFHSWDAEFSLRDLNSNRVDLPNSNGAATFYLPLLQVEEFRLLYADRIQSLFFNGGLLTPEENIKRYDLLAAPIDRAIVGESARWGDGYNDSSGAKTRADWLNRLQWTRDTFFQQRGDIVLAQFQAAGLYPTTGAPKFNQHGGQVDPGFELTMEIQSIGDVFIDTVILPEFTDGTYFVPTNDDLGTSWTTWAYNDSLWAPGTTGVGYENSNGYQNIINTTVRPQDVDPDATSIFLRIPFSIDDPAGVDRLLLRMKYDDGFVAYINGQEVQRRNISGTPPSWNDRASGHEAGAFENFDITAYKYTLVQGGQNVLAIHGLNTSTGSSDMIILPELSIGSRVIDPIEPVIYYTTDGSDPRAADGNASASAVPYVEGNPLALAESTLIKTRTNHNGQWSALSEAEFFVGTQATAENLVITELNYNPYDPPQDDDTYNNDDFEFIELYNRSDDTIDLTGLEFSGGIELDFTGSRVPRLGPHEFVVAVSDEAAFAQRYETGGILVAGQYTGRLANNGESLELLDSVGNAVADFAYNDGGGWPGRADGKGASLELKDPAAVPAAEAERTVFLEDDDNWRSSSEYGGTPGFPGRGPIGDVVINEVLSHTDPPASDSIELYNTTRAGIDIGGWYLSDTSRNYLKFRIPEGTEIAAYGYVVFNEDDFKPTWSDPQPVPGPADFALDGAHGEDVWLMQADDQDKLLRFVDHVDFGAAANGESFGRWSNGVGDLYPMSELTLGPEGEFEFDNSGPRVGPVFISELHYNHNELDDDRDLEFIEIYNPTSLAVELAHWRIRKGIDFDFPDDAVLQPGTALVIVPFDPDDPDDGDLLTAFYTAHGIDDTVQMLGGYSGRLSDTGERVQLQRADEPPQDEQDFYPPLLEDEIRYGNQAPWPVDADGGMQSLNRLGGSPWGNDPASWMAMSPTPGSVEFVTAATVIGRHVFYNNSAFNTEQEAIATDKQALLPGGTAGFANYTSFDKGINGIIIDIAGLEGRTPGKGDFRFLVGNDATPADWDAGPQPISVTVQIEGGDADSDRVTIVWQDALAVRNQWLQVTVLKGDNTNLAADDVFYFGNAVGESGNSAGDAKVNATDLLLARNNPRNFVVSAAVDFRYDFDRDGRVNATDMLIARANQTHFLNALKLINVPLGKSATTTAQPTGENIAPDELAWLYEFEHRGGDDRQAAKNKAAEGSGEVLDVFWP